MGPSRRWTGAAADRLRRGLRRLPTGVKDVARRSASVSVVVTVSEEQRELLAACLASIPVEERVEVQVVDHGAGTEHATLGEARAAAAARSEGDYLIFLEASETLAPGALREMVERLEASGSDFAVGGLDQEGETGDGARHPNRAGVTIRDYPEAVVDRAWGNKLFRRTFWDATIPALPATGVSGLGALLVRAYTEATFDLLPQVVSEAADPAAGLPFGQVLTVMDGVEEWLVALAESDRLLRPAELAPVRRTWLTSLLTDEAIRYVDGVDSATQEQWEALCRGLAPLIGEAETDLLPTLPWESRVKTWLVAQQRRQTLEEFLHRRRWEGPGTPTEVLDGRVHATVWPYRDPQVAMPDECFELTPAETPLVASLRMVRWLDAETLVLDIFAYAELVPDGTDPPSLTAALVDEEGDSRVEVEVEHAPSAEVTRFARERFQDHDQGGFRLVVRAAPLLAAARWSLELILTSNRVTRTGTVNDRELNGVVGERPRRIHGGRLWGPSPQGRDGVVIEVVRPSVLLSDAEVEARAVRGVLTGAPVTTVALTRAGQQVQAPVDASGRFEAHLPDVGFAEPERPEWELVAVGPDGTRRPVAFPAESGPWIGDAAGLIAWHRSRGGHAAVHEVTHRAVVTDVALHDDELVVSLGWLGAVPEDWSLSLVNARVTLAGTTVDTADRAATVRLPTTCDEWGLGTTTAPTGVYRLELTVGRGEEAWSTEAVGTEGDLVTRTPVDLLGEKIRVRLRQTPRHQLVAHLTAPQSDDEVGPRMQRLLHEEYQAKQHVLDPDAVYLQAYTGQSATDSARAIHEHLRRHYPHLTLYWGVADHSVHLPEGAVPVVMRTREWYDVLGRSTYLVNNIEFDKWFVKQPGQRFLQTFHGYPAKSMGIVQWRAKRFPERRIEAELERTMRKWDLILTPSPEMDEYYRREYRYEGPIANQGYPRDDVLVSTEVEGVREATRERLGIAPEQKVVLYAPTFRDHLATAHRSAELAAHLDLETASEALGEEYVFLMRGHRFHSAGAHRLGRHRRLVDVTAYPEVNDLILASDAAVLDYSSLRFDFALTRKPMVFLVPDLEVYSGPVRGFLYDYRSTAPGPLLTDAAQVVDALRDLDRLAAEHRDELETFLETYQRWQDGHATERVVRAFFGEPPVAGG